MTAPPWHWGPLPGSSTNFPWSLLNDLARQDWSLTMGSIRYLQERAQNRLIEIVKKPIMTAPPWLWGPLPGPSGSSVDHSCLFAYLYLVRPVASMLASTTPAGSDLRFDLLDVLVGGQHGSFAVYHTTDTSWSYSSTKAFATRLLIQLGLLAGSTFFWYRLCKESRRHLILIGIDIFTNCTRLARYNARPGW